MLPERLWLDGRKYCFRHLHLQNDMSKRNTEDDTTDSDSSISSTHSPILRHKQRRLNCSQIHKWASDSAWTQTQAKNELHLSYYSTYLNLQEVLSKGIDFKQQLSMQQQEHFDRLNSCITFDFNCEDFCNPDYKADIIDAIEGVKNELAYGEVHWDKRVYVIQFMERLRSLITDVRTTEGNYTNLMYDLAQMCLLHVEFDSGKLQWTGLKGKTVTSNPDLRFRPFGLKETVSQSSVCIVKIKKNTIENFYGQHAVELLVDLHHLPKDKFERSPEYSIPGLIVDGTKVQFTVLTIAKDHYEKLKDDKELDVEDQAVIYTSGFFDITVKRHRDAVMKALISLNEME